MGLTALHMAAGYVRPSTTKLLLESGADPELRTARNERALDLIRNLRNSTKPSSMGGLVTDKRYPLMTEIMELLQSVAEDPDEWVVPAPLKPDPAQEAALKAAAENARKLVEEMKKDPEKLKELEEAMKLMQDPEFQKKVSSIPLTHLLMALRYIRTFTRHSAHRRLIQRVLAHCAYPRSLPHSLLHPSSFLNLSFLHPSFTSASLHPCPYLTALPPPPPQPGPSPRTVVPPRPFRPAHPHAAVAPHAPAPHPRGGLASRKSDSGRWRGSREAGC